MTRVPLPVNQAKESIPLSSAITESLEEKKPEFDETKNKLAAELADLKARIQTARELANRVPVGINFVESSNLVLGNPQSLDTQQVQTKIGLFFKTQEPQGLLLFLGNEPGRKPEVSQVMGHFQ
jgi:laminin alpha 3/5